jgi:hypothetical protein
MSWTECIDAALSDLGQFLRESEWYGRENELVNLFAHAFLVGRPGPGGPVPATHLGIEVAVKQLKEIDGKDVVRKDLVIWSKPNQTLWRNREPLNTPVAVVEFKRNNEKECLPDLEWLAAFTKANAGVLGYSVCGFINERRGISFTRFMDGTRRFHSCSPSDVLPRKVKRGKFVSDHVRIVDDGQQGPL